MTINACHPIIDLFNSSLMSVTTSPLKNSKIARVPSSWFTQILTPTEGQMKNKNNIIHFKFKSVILTKNVRIQNIQDIYQRATLSYPIMTLRNSSMLTLPSPVLSATLIISWISSSVTQIPGLLSTLPKSSPLMLPSPSVSITANASRNS